MSDINAEIEEASNTPAGNAAILSDTKEALQTLALNPA
jgi:hypothetical protein